MSKSNDESIKEQTNRTISDFNKLDSKMQVLTIVNRTSDYQSLLKELKAWMNKD